MSRRGFAVCLGLIVSGAGASASAQQGGYAMDPNQPQAYANHGYAEQGYQPAYGAPACNSCGPQAYGGGDYSPFWNTYYRNVRWPMPFRAQDVSSVTQYFDIQRENGWRLHNTVGNAMFDSRTNCLTQAGKNHIQSILRDNPNDRKVVFVLQGQTPQQTSTRVQSTELAISELLPVGSLPPVYVTDRDAPGSSGAYQTAVTQAMMSSVPAPRLTSSSNGGSSTGSGSGTP